MMPFTFTSSPYFLSRDSSDDGVLTALLMPVIIGAANLYVSLKSLLSGGPDATPLPYWWRIEEPVSLTKYGPKKTVMQSLVLSRRNLLQQATFCSFLLLLHLTASRQLESRHRARKRTPDEERGSVPRKEARRTRYYILFVISTSLASLGLRWGFAQLKIPIWSGS